MKKKEMRRYVVAHAWIVPPEVMYPNILGLTQDTLRFLQESFPIPREWFPESSSSWGVFARALREKQYAFSSNWTQWHTEDYHVCFWPEEPTPYSWNIQLKARFFPVAQEDLLEQQPAEEKGEWEGVLCDPHVVNVQSQWSSEAPDAMREGLTRTFVLQSWHVGATPEEEKFTETREGWKKDPPINRIPLPWSMIHRLLPDVPEPVWEPDLSLERIRGFLEAKKTMVQEEWESNPVWKARWGDRHLEDILIEFYWDIRLKVYQKDTLPQSEYLFFPPALIPVPHRGSLPQHVLEGGVREEKQLQQSISQEELKEAQRLIHSSALQPWNSVGSVLTMLQGLWPFYRFHMTWYDLPFSKEASPKTLLESSQLMQAEGMASRALMEPLWGTLVQRQIEENVQKDSEDPYRSYWNRLHREELLPSWRTHRPLAPCPLFMHYSPDELMKLWKELCSEVELPVFTSSVPLICATGWIRSLPFLLESSGPIYVSQRSSSMEGYGKSESIGPIPISSFVIQCECMWPEKLEEGEWKPEMKREEEPFVDKAYQWSWYKHPEGKPECTILLGLGKQWYGFVVSGDPTDYWKSFLTFAQRRGIHDIAWQTPLRPPVDIQLETNTGMALLYYPLIRTWIRGNHREGCQWDVSNALVGLSQWNVEMVQELVQPPFQLRNFQQHRLREVHLGTRLEMEDRNPIVQQRLKWLVLLMYMNQRCMMDQYLQMPENEISHRWGFIQEVRPWPKEEDLLSMTLSIFQK